MEFDLEKRDLPNRGHYSKEDHETAKEFAEGMEEEFDDFVKEVVLFGSSARKEKALDEGDIDVLVVVNDMTMVVNKQVIEGYRIITTNLSASISENLHITTLKLSNFWESVKSGDPVMINILRDGVPLIESDFFEPLQMLLHKGRIRPTKEAVWNYYMKAPKTLKNSRWHILQGVLDLYWAVMDSAHAALMHAGCVPPSPEHAHELILKHLVKPGYVDKKYSKRMKSFYDLAKKIDHKKIVSISGEEYERYYKEAKDFVKTMRRYIGIHREDDKSK